MTRHKSIDIEGYKLKHMKDGRYYLLRCALNNMIDSIMEKLPEHFSKECVLKKTIELFPDSYDKFCIIFGKEATDKWITVQYVQHIRTDLFKKVETTPIPINGRNLCFKFKETIWGKVR